jgi:hypothetical protein
MPCRLQRPTPSLHTSNGDMLTYCLPDPGPVLPSPHASPGACASHVTSQPKCSCQVLPHCHQQPAASHAQDQPNSPWFGFRLQDPLSLKPNTHAPTIQPGLVAHPPPTHPHINLKGQGSSPQSRVLLPGSAALRLASHTHAPTHAPTHPPTPHPTLTNSSRQSRVLPGDALPPAAHTHDPTTQPGSDCTPLPPPPAVACRPPHHTSTQRQLTSKPRAAAR